jgi:hypothetical protein
MNSGTLIPLNKYKVHKDIFKEKQKGLETKKKSYSKHTKIINVPVTIYYFVRGWSNLYGFF